MVYSSLASKIGQTSKIETNMVPLNVISSVGLRYFARSRTEARNMI